jgi:hypothetical protein
MKLTLIPAFLFLAAGVTAAAQVQRAEPQPAAATKAQPPAAVSLADTADAEQIRARFHQLLDRQPPAVRRILALDPTLLASQSYLSTYPELAAFLAAHPVIVRNPAYYLGTGEDVPRGAEERLMELWSNVLEATAVLIGMGLAASLVAWLIRTLIDYRKWSRAARVQAEVHAKILDRLASNDDLLAYVRTPAGEKFLQSAPIHVESAAKPVAAPLGRILWAVQGGIVLMAAGAGLLFISTRVSAIAAQPLQAFGTLALALGCGFLLSAGASYLLSRRLGLIPSPAPGAGGREALL